MWSARVIRLVGVAVGPKQTMRVIVDGVDKVSICLQCILVHVDYFFSRLLVLWDTKK